MLTQWWQKNRQGLIAHYCQHCLLPIEPRLVQKTQPWQLCQPCIEMLSSQPRCRRCGITTLSEVRQCGNCLTDPPPWRQLYCVGDYLPPLSDYVQQLKFARQLHYVDVLADLLAQQVPPDTELLSYVPLHWRRQLWRGFNQSEFLARALSRRLDIPCASLFKRTRSTHSQRGMDRQQRQRNLHNAFQVSVATKAHSVAIVDDVVTTGSTVQHLCKLLLDVGVKSVDIYCICRTPEPIRNSKA